jgi:UDP-N-acetylmuramoyl-L-alanyl-D-glutamate--2,6-diaminopimelate ligase
MKGIKKVAGAGKISFEKILAIAGSPGSPDICCDSRLVKKGDIFIAIKGAHVDGHNFIDQAVKNGAKYIIIQEDSKPSTFNPDCIYITVPNSAEAAAVLTQAKKGNPASKLINLAVTGTNGKTTTAFLVRSIINNSGGKCGLIGTVLYDNGEKIVQAKLTTPNQFVIAEITSQMVNTGCKFMITEASSHALDQDRLEGINFRAAAFTNLTGDHLDYHKTKDSYLSAKTKLFQTLSQDSFAILNKQSPEALSIAKNIKAKILWYSIGEPADLTAYIKSMDMTGTVFSLEFKGLAELVKTSLVGEYNISNCLAAAGLALAAGFDLKTVAKGIEALDAVPGRLQKVRHNNPFTVLVDYAHTDDALKNVLETIRPLCKGKLIVVFGCGGDRDKTKRPRMAKVVRNYADRIVVTSDNPRTEDPAGIIRDIIAGFDENNDNIKIEPDRECAIALAVGYARKDDIVLIAGKGHEDYQILKDKTIHFSDVETAEKFLKEKNEKAFCKSAC